MNKTISFFVIGAIAASLLGIGIASTNMAFAATATSDQYDANGFLRSDSFSDGLSTAAASGGQDGTTFGGAASASDTGPSTAAGGANGNCPNSDFNFGGCSESIP